MNEIPVSGFLNKHPLGFIVFFENLYYLTS